MQNRQRIISHATKCYSDFEIRNALDNAGFNISIHSLKSKELSLIVLHGIKITRSFGAHIEHIIAVPFQLVEDSTDFKLLDKSLHKILARTEQSYNILAVRQRYIIYCFYGNDICENNIRNILEHFDYKFSIVFPVAIDTKDKTIFHPMIPEKIPSRKKRSFASLLNSLEQIFYSDSL